MDQEKEICLEQYRSRCEERQSIIISRDDKHDWRHVAHNAGGRVRHFKLDGEVLPRGETPERCDFLLLDDDEKTAYFIELKGSPSYLKKCVAQVESTERMCRQSLKGYTKRFYRFILGSGHGVPPSAFITWRDKKPKGTVVVHRGRYEEHF